MNLATIQKIKAIKEIPGADSIEVAEVLGWQVVVRKGQFKEGDLCVYIQIDTVVPDKPEFEFLRERGFRVRTIKLRKQISQGLIGTIEEFLHTTDRGKIREGCDVTEWVGVKKYEKPDTNPAVLEKPRMPKKWWKKWIYLFKYNVLYKMFPGLRPKLRSPFPTNLVPITDEERIQNIPHVLEQYKDKDFMVSYKLDGSSITIIHNKVLGKSKYRICSRRFELHCKKNDWYKVFESNNFDRHILRLVDHFGTNDIIVQGECIGKFNGNHHNLQKDEIRLFNIYVDGKRVDQKTFYAVCESLNIPHCPLYNIVFMKYNMEQILAMSNIMDPLNPRVPAEGLVWRDVDNTISFKVINNAYLMKEK